MTHTIQLVAGFLIGAVLLSGSIIKWANFPQFVDSIRKYQLTPKSVSAIVAFIVALGELVAGVSLVTRRLPEWGAYIALALFLLFAGAVFINVLRGKFDLECGCGMWGKSRIGWQLVLRNLGLSGLAVLAAAILVSSSPWTLVSAFVASLVLVILPVIPKTPCHQ